MWPRRYLVQEEEGCPELRISGHQYHPARQTSFISRHDDRRASSNEAWENMTQSPVSAASAMRKLAPSTSRSSHPDCRSASTTFVMVTESAMRTVTLTSFDTRAEMLALARHRKGRRSTTMSARSAALAAMSNLVSLESSSDPSATKFHRAVSRGSAYCRYGRPKQRAGRGRTVFRTRSSGVGPGLSASE